MLSGPASQSRRCGGEQSERGRIHGATAMLRMQSSARQANYLGQFCCHVYNGRTSGLIELNEQAGDHRSRLQRHSAAAAAILC